MSTIVKAVAGVVLIAVGVVLDAYGQEYGSYFIKAGALLLLNAAAEALGPKAPSQPPLAGLTVNYSGTLEPRRIIFGKVRVGGMNCIPPMTSGSNNDYFHQVTAYAGHAVTAIDDVYLGTVLIPSANIGSISGSDSDGVVSGFSAPAAGTVNGFGYNNEAWLRRYDGTQTTVDFILNHAFTAWDSNHKGQGIPYLAMRLKYDTKNSSSGVPAPSVIIRGAKLYDPRLDSTNGGSGSQRATTASTWTYSTNPALALRWYLTNAQLGLGEAQANIDDTLVAAAASKCDESVTVPIPVLGGLTNWTNASAIVTGVSTRFLGTLVGSGGYVKSPVGTMLQVLSVQSDTQFTLTANYTGSNASNQVTQYNNAGSGATVSQSRYTCNTVLDATARYEDNIAVLAASMMGHCLNSGGVWKIYAGGWAGSAFSLDETCLVGGITVQANTPRQDLYNAVRGNFIDPQQGYQASEFAPVLNATYASDDGETIYVETSYPCCTDRYEAQRNSILTLRQSRNRRVITAQFGMIAYGVKVWETGTVSIAEIGWVNQTVRCTSWKFTPSGVVELQLQEAYSADWTDPLTSDYSVTSIGVGVDPLEYLPYPPTGMTITPSSGYIEFKITLPDQLIPGSLIELWEYTANTPFSSASRVYIGSSDTIKLLKFDTTTRYYWARTRSHTGNQFSTTFPSGNGSAGLALTSADQVYTPWVRVGNTSVSDSNVTKTSGSTGWDAGCYSINGYLTCHITGKAGRLGSTSRACIGLSQSPTTSIDRANMDYGWYTNAVSGWTIFELGSVVSGFSVATLTDVVTVTYDGSTITYYLNGVSVRTVSTAGKTFYGFAPIFDSGMKINSLEFGPTDNITINDTAQIGDDAVSQMVSLYDGPGVVGSAVSGTPVVNGVLKSLSITTGGAPVAVDVSVGFPDIGLTSGTTNWAVTSVTVFRDGSSTGTCPVVQFDQSKITWVANGHAHILPFAFTFVDSGASAGTHTYTIVWSGSNTGGSGIGTALTLTQISMKLREIKK